MTVFYCSRCGLALTPDLIALPEVPLAPEESYRGRPKGVTLAPSTIPRGYYAIESEPWGAPFVPGEHGSARSAGQRNMIVLHPEDVPALEWPPDEWNAGGCCGPSGNEGPNQVCPCGVRLATLTADCLGPYELHLDPIRTYAFTQ